MPKEQQDGNSDSSSEELLLSLECLGRQSSTTYQARGDKIIKIIQNVFMSDDSIGVKSGTDRKKAVEALRRSAENLHSSLKGIKVRITDKDNGFDVSTEYDLEKADLKQLEEEGLLQGGDETSSYVSFQKTRDRLNDKACPEGVSLSREDS